jgi:hypothetical protein
MVRRSYQSLITKFIAMTSMCRVDILLKARNRNSKDVDHYLNWFPNVQEARFVCEKVATQKDAHASALSSDRSVMKCKLLCTASLVMCKIRLKGAS